jgi:hypothetical protein
MPPILLILPEACCLGVSPNPTANALGRLNAWPLSMAVNNAEAFITPIPRMLSNILPLSLSSTNIRHCCSIPFRRLSVVSYSINISITLFNLPSNALWPQGNTTANSLNNPLDWCSKPFFLMRRSRIRYKQNISCWCSGFAGTNRILAR